MVLKEGVKEHSLVFKFRVNNSDYSIYVSSDTDMRCLKWAETGHLVHSCPQKQNGCP